MLSLNAQTVDTPVKQLLLSLSDDDLVRAAMNGRTGKCSIVNAKNCPQCFCDFYAKTSKAGLLGVGLPHGYGSGCIVAPDSPRRIDICWGAPNVYDQYNNSKTPICGRSLSNNAANMIRIGIQRGLCDLPDQMKEAVVPPFKDPIKDPVKECMDSVKSKDEELRKTKESLISQRSELDKQKKQIEIERKQQNQELTKEKDKVKNQANEIEKRTKELENCRKQLEEEKRKNLHKAGLH